MSASHRAKVRSYLKPRRTGYRFTCLVLRGSLLLFGLLYVPRVRAETEPNQPELIDFRSVVIGLGDSLTHGTLDAANNATNTLNAYLQKVVESLKQVTTVSFSQPLFDVDENRLRPFHLPTNLAVDGADSFSIEGVEYYKRVGADQSFVNPDYLCDKLLPASLSDPYDKVLYPINLLDGMPVSQIDAANWILANVAAVNGKATVILWIGNNDSSTAALGFGGENPTFFPLPVDEIAPLIKPVLRRLLRFGEQVGAVSFESYTFSAIERNLTSLEDFIPQFNRILERLRTENPASPEHVNFFVLTLPYYSSVGYLMDSDDVEFYLRKLNAAYSVPPTFKRVQPPDLLTGDRISLLTFGLMYGLLDSGFSVNYVNQILEKNGLQRDDLVLSEAEQAFIVERIDSFNATIADVAASHGINTHLVDTGRFLNLALTGRLEFKVGDKVLTRRWVRGSAFSLDGVHPSYTGQALIANFVLDRLNHTLGLNAPLHDLELILNSDPYVDRDEDGWAPGPAYPPKGLTELLFMFKDPDDTDPASQADLPPDFWDRVSDIILGQILGISAIRQEAERLGITP